MQSDELVYNEINEDKIGYFLAIECDHNEEYSKKEKRMLEYHLLKLGIID